ncbi:hypothetical protein Q8A67_021679 [Cirrhinus molitorella]|uniref:DUF6729 domain-containing protein n=1 Tax=Cirrhinus molitorella TaxID=172907 RepID=A0AA88TEN0_9TELE|nr:hypothetical protein Q8A67_021679 [Cirrhinus molitorella]
MEPRFRRRADGSLNLTDTMEAAKVKEANKGRPYARPLSPEVVLDKAKKSLRQLKVDPTNRKHLLGFFEIQFGVFRGQTFKWVAENALGYAAYPVTAMKRDPTGGSKDSQEHAHNKESFREYMELFPSGRIAIAMKEEQYAEKAPQHSATTTHTAATTTHAAATSTHAVATSTHAAATSMHATATSLRSLLVGKLPSKTKHIALAQACVQPSATITCPTVSTEAATEPSATVTSPTVSTEIDDSTLMAEASNFEEAYVASQRVCLPAGWLHTLPEVDQRWMSKALFRWTAQGHPELVFSRVDRLWWYPPQVPLKTSYSPSLENYFGHPLLLWMPRKLWQVKLTCLHPDCQKVLLTSAGLHQKLGKWLLWVPCTLWHLSTWPAQNVRGKSSAGVMTLSPNLTLATGCSSLASSHQNLHMHRWLMQVYAQDVLQRLDEIKATITSQYGRILKMDSTKKVARKLAGHTSEGFGLGLMIEGLISRYRVAGVAPPEVLYVDRDCCGNTLLRRMFKEWDQMTIRLDIWHFMRRFTVGCTTDSHQLYATFMSRLSHCIFMWDQVDLTALKKAKQAELEADRKPSSEADVLRCISRNELALHCRRTTRGTKETQTMTEGLIQAFCGEAGCDTLGVPLINTARMIEILKSQWKHVACIQDPPGVQLYLQTGTLLKGGHRLPTYRCARGSTSLESFHLHLNRFIPGTLASDTFFQAYLLDGLAWWNEDRAVAATTDEQQPHSYNHLLRHAANTLAEEIWGTKIIPYVGPRKYTGELIGVEYLYQQTSKVFQDYRLAIEVSETSEVAMEVEESCGELEEIQDITVPTFETERPPAASSMSAAPCPTPPAPSRMSSFVFPPSPVTSTVTSFMTSLSVVPPSPATSTITSSMTSLSVVPPSPVTSMMSLSVVSVAEEITSHDDSVGPDNIEGYGAVQDLAEFLVSLRDHRLALTGEECAKIITLWQALGKYDKKKTVYPPRHQTALKQGRFRAMKKIVAPGVESTKRCFVGAHSPAQWPDCNRVVEAIFTKLCTLYPNAVRCEGVRVSRFTMIARAYKHIRECILTNAKVMSETTIQLPEVNAATVTQWFSRRCRSQEQEILKQGIQASDAPMAGPENLPAAMQKGPALFSGNLAEPHLFVLPPNTAGEAKLKGRSQPQAIAQAPITSRTPCHCTSTTRLSSFHFAICSASYSDSRKRTSLYSAWCLTGDVLQHPFTFSYATISSDTDKSSCSLLHSAIQEEKTGEGADRNRH